MFKNLKIKILDEQHLKAVCEVLKSMGYIQPNSGGSIIYTSEHGNTFTCDGNWALDAQGIYKDANLTDLLQMRDEMIKEKINGFN